jgi:hypothetical protein
VPFVVATNESKEGVMEEKARVLRGSGDRALGLPHLRKLCITIVQHGLPRLALDVVVGDTGSRHLV